MKKEVKKTGKNIPITKKLMQELPVGTHLHPFPSRKARREEAFKTKPGNNRAKTKCRAKYKGMKFKDGRYIKFETLLKLRKAKP